MSDKITVNHLERGAYVYIRQSTLHQVRNNVESGRRQYALENRARELGFKNVVVIDEDLGSPARAIANDRALAGCWSGVQGRSGRRVRSGGIAAGAQQP